MHIRFQFREDHFTYDIPVIKMQRYTLDDLLQKNLLFLLPFYIFTCDKDMKEYNTNEKKLSSLKAEYQRIITHLNTLEYRGQLSTYYKKTLIEMSEKVVDNLAAKYANIRKEVRSVMGGKILEYEAKTILRQGHLEALVQYIQSLMNTMGWSAEHAIDMMQVSEEDRAAVSERL